VIALVCNNKKTGCSLVQLPVHDQSKMTQKKEKKLDRDFLMRFVINTSGPLSNCSVTAPLECIEEGARNHHRAIR
jgi:hypothetical protein